MHENQPPSEGPEQGSICPGASCWAPPPLPPPPQLPLKEPTQAGPVDSYMAVDFTFHIVKSWSQSHLGDTPVRASVQAFSEKINQGRETHIGCGWDHSMGWGPGLGKKGY